jgi:hypothetical protein
MKKINYINYWSAFCIGCVVSCLFFMLLEWLRLPEFAKGLFTGTVGGMATRGVLDYFDKQEKAAENKQHES